MAFRKLGAATMIAISAPMVDPEKDRSLLESYPMTAGLVFVLVAIHNALMKIRSTVSETMKKARQLSEQAKELNGRYDGLYRSLYSVLTAWSVTTSDEARRVLMEKIRDILFPEGLSGIQRSYLASAGMADQAMSQVTPEIEAMLREIVVDGRTLYEIFMEWVETGKQLGEVERQRMLFADAEERGQVSAGDVQNARFRWIRFMKALRILLELDESIPAEIKTRVLQPLQIAERKYSGSKSSSGQSEESDDETDEDEMDSSDTDSPSNDKGEASPDAKPVSNDEKPSASQPAAKAVG